MYHHFSNQNLKTVVCDRSCLYGYFLYHRWELHESIKTREVLLTGLTKSHALTSFFEVSNLSQMHKRCKTGTQTFFKYHGKNLSQKLSYVPLFFFFSSACCHQLNCFPTYYTVGWTTNDLLLITLRFFKTHYSLQLMWLVLNPVPNSNNEPSFTTN